MIDSDRVTELEKRLAQAEQRIAALEARPHYVLPYYTPMPPQIAPLPLWQPPYVVTCGAVAGTGDAR